MSIRALTPELAEKARKELNEDPNRLKDDVQHLKDWIAKQPHLLARTDDQWLVAFLRGCKYSLERTKEKLDLYYSIRTTAPELFKTDHTSPNFDEILSSGVFLVLPKTAGPDSPRVVLVRPGKINPERITMIEMMGAINSIQKISLMEDDHTSVAGSVMINDFEGITMAHFLQMTPTMMKKMSVINQNATPMRMKGSHFINPPSAFETIFNTFKSMLNEKNRNRIYVHSSFDVLYKHIPQSILPVEYGGTGGTIEEIVDYWRKKVQEYKPFLDEDLKYRTIEAKRPGKPKTAEDIFGAEGSFRKLEVD